MNSCIIIINCGYSYFRFKITYSKWKCLSMHGKGIATLGKQYDDGSFVGNF